MEVEMGYVDVDFVDQTDWRDLVDVDKKDLFCAYDADKIL